ncbi:hypothetical protein GGF50DRAFT_102066 [Schizophyllum commune]
MNSSATASDNARSPLVGTRQRKLSIRPSTLNVRRQGMYGTDETVAELESLISGSSRGTAQEPSPVYPTPTSIRSPSGTSRHARLPSGSSTSVIGAPGRASNVDVERRPRQTQSLTPAQELAREYRQSLAQSPSPPRHTRHLSAQVPGPKGSRRTDSNGNRLSMYDDAYFATKTKVDEASIAGVKSLLIQDTQSDKRSSVLSSRTRSMYETASSAGGSWVIPTPPSSHFDSAVELKSPPRATSMASPPSSALLERRRSKPLPPIICDKPVSASPVSSATAPNSASTITANLLTPKIRSTESRAADMQELAEIAARIVVQQGKGPNDRVRCPIPGCRDVLENAKKLALHLHIHELDERIYDPNAHAVRDLSLYASTGGLPVPYTVRSSNTSPLKETFSHIMNALKP